MKNFDSIPVNHGPQPSSRSGRERQYEQTIEDRIQAGETQVQELLEKMGSGVTLADLGEQGIIIEQRLEELKAEKNHRGGDSIMKLAQLTKAIKEVGPTTTH